MARLRISVSELLLRATAFYAAAVFAMRAASFKGRLRYARIDRRRDRR
jgi:hypothetical protein